MSIYIISHADDTHAIAVEYALQRLGAQVRNWHWADFPGIDRFSAELSNDGEWHSLRADDAHERSVWIRRGLRPQPGPDTHPADTAFVSRESSEMLNGMLGDLADGAFCVNPPLAAKRWRAKMNQLTLASRCGLAIPRSLFSNEPARIRAFCRQAGGELIMKPFTPAAWHVGQSMFVPYTTPVVLAQLDNDAQLASCPAIYQEKLDKLFELRVTFMGQQLWVARIDSQQHRESIDWRGDFNGAPPLSHFTLDPMHETALRRFIDATGLVYGCIDIVVTRDGRFVFLEVNEMGQFLWVEEIDPGFPLLDCFARLLISGSPDFVYEGGQDIVHFADTEPLITPDALAARKAGHAERRAGFEVDETTAA